MGYKLKHIYAFKRACKDLWQYSKEQREAGGPLRVRDVTGSEATLSVRGLCHALVLHYTETGERLAGGPLDELPYDLYSTYNEHCGYLPGELGEWTPERVALLKFYCKTPSGELLKRLVGSPYNREVRGEDT